jgi:hypothetical protein
MRILGLCDDYYHPARTPRTGLAGLEDSVCLLTPGHNVDVWLHPSYQALIQNALRWVIPQEHVR